MSELIARLLYIELGFSIFGHLHTHLNSLHSVSECSQSTDIPGASVKMLPPCCSKVEQVPALHAGPHIQWLDCTYQPAGRAMPSDEECSDHVIVGTKAGDCLFLDAARDGQVMLCFPAHRCYLQPAYLPMLLKA